MPTPRCSCAGLAHAPACWCGHSCSGCVAFLGVSLERHALPEPLTQKVRFGTPAIYRTAGRQAESNVSVAGNMLCTSTTTTSRICFTACAPLRSSPRAPLDTCGHKRSESAVGTISARYCRSATGTASTDGLLPQAYRRSGQPRWRGMTRHKRMRSIPCTRIRGVYTQPQQSTTHDGKQQAELCKRMR
jgi:hypothetical protein